MGKSLFVIHGDEHYCDDGLIKDDDGEVKGKWMAEDGRVLNKYQNDASFLGACGHAQLAYDEYVTASVVEQIMME